MEKHIVSIQISAAIFSLNLQCRKAGKVVVVQWLGFLLCDQKVMGSNPGWSKGVFFRA